MLIKTKRIFSLTLVLTIMLMMVPAIPSFAATTVNFNVTASTVEVPEGTTTEISVPVRITKVPTDTVIGAMALKFVVDQSQLTFQSIENGPLIIMPGQDVLPSELPEENGSQGTYVHMFAAGGDSRVINTATVTTNNLYVTLKYKLAANLPAGTYPINILPAAELNDNANGTIIGKTELAEYLTAGAIVVKGADKITAIAPIAPKTVQNGTAWSNVGLPTTVTATYGSTTKTLPVAWTQPAAYGDGTIAGPYTVEGNVDYTGCLVNSSLLDANNKLKISTTVTVKPGLSVNFNVTADTVTVQQGTTTEISIPVKITKVPADKVIGAMALKFVVDPSQLTFQSIENGPLIIMPGQDVLPSELPEENGSQGTYVHMFAAGGDARVISTATVTANNLYVTLKYKLAANLPAGTYPINILPAAELNDNANGTIILKTDLADYLTAGAIVVKSEPDKITAIAPVAAKTVANGTAWANVGLPTTVTATYGATTKDLPVTWTKPSTYGTGTTAGNYTVVGKVTYAPYEVDQSLLTGTDLKISTTVTVLSEAPKKVTAIEIPDIVIDKNMTFEDAKELLPSKLKVTLEDGSTTQVDVTWDEDSYEALISGEAATINFDLPGNYEVNQGVELNVTPEVIEVEIDSATTVNITVANGTTKAKVIDKLPAVIKAKASSGVKWNAGISSEGDLAVEDWECSNYKSTVAGRYTFEANFVENGFTFDATPTAIVTVKAGASSDGGTSIYTGNRNIYINTEEEATPEIKFNMNGNAYTVDGVAKTSDVAFIYNDNGDRAMAPVRFIAESLGYTVSWDGVSKVTITNGTKTVVFEIGNDTMYVNGAAVQMDTAPILNNDRTYLPIRYIANAFDLTIGWDEVAQQVTLK